MDGLHVEAGEWVAAACGLRACSVVGVQLAGRGAEMRKGGIPSSDRIDGLHAEGRTWVVASSATWGLRACGVAGGCAAVREGEGKAAEDGWAAC